VQESCNALARRWLLAPWAISTILLDTIVEDVKVLLREVEHGSPRLSSTVMGATTSFVGTRILLCACPALLLDPTPEMEGTEDL